jgi:hypothetical protein
MAQQKARLTEAFAVIIIDFDSPLSCKVVARDMPEKVCAGPSGVVGTRCKKKGVPALSLSCPSEFGFFLREKSKLT